MNLPDVVNFLKIIAPFHAIDEAGPAEIAGNMTAESFAPKEFIIKQGVHGLNFYIIRSGLVRAYSQGSDGKENVLAYLGEGDCFGEISLLSGRPTTANIQALENTDCLIQTKDHFLRMAKQYPMLMDFFDQLMNNRLKNSYREFLSQESGVTNVEPYLYTKQVKDMMSPFSGLANEKDTIKDVAKKLIEKSTAAQIVINDQGEPKGLISINTIARATLFENIDPDGTIEGIFEKEFHSIESDSYFFDALHNMIKNKTGILVVTEGQTARGILTGFDLLRFRGREVLSLLRNIRNAEDYTQLNSMRNEIEKVLREIMADGALASQACKIVSEFNDKVVAKVIQFAENECGPPPCAYAWLGLGSEGRKEQTLFTDQDNAIIFRHGNGSNPAEYFKGFSRSVVNGLNICGIPLCKGEIMASNPKFSGDMEEWKDRTARWILSSSLSEKDMMDTYVFLDFRLLQGEQSLEKELKNHIFKLIQKNPAFLKGLAGTIVSIPMPVGFFKNFIVEKTGEHKDRLNLKLYGLVPLITCVKILAIQHGIAETNTLERIKALGRLNIISADLEEFLEQAFETFLTLKIRNNLFDIEQGKTFGNFIKPAELSTRQKQLLKEAFWAVSELQKATHNLLRVNDGSDLSQSWR